MTGNPAAHKEALNSNHSYRGHSYSTDKHERGDSPWRLTCSQTHVHILSGHITPLGMVEITHSQSTTLSLALLVLSWGLSCLPLTHACACLSLSGSLQRCNFFPSRPLSISLHVNNDAFRLQNIASSWVHCYASNSCFDLYFVFVLFVFFCSALCIALFLILFCTLFYFVLLFVHFCLVFVVFCFVLFRFPFFCFVFCFIYLLFFLWWPRELNELQL